MQSKNSRRTSVLGSAGGALWSESFIQRSYTNASIELFGWLGPATIGGIGLPSGRNAQCSRYSAPDWTQLVICSTCRFVRPGPSGGIRWLGSSEEILRSISLAFKSPGTIGLRPLSLSLVAFANSCNATPDSCLSGPWHEKHCLARIGRMVRLKSTDNDLLESAIAGRFHETKRMTTQEVVLITNEDNKVDTKMRLKKFALKTRFK